MHIHTNEDLRSRVVWKSVGKEAKSLEIVGKAGEKLCNQYKSLVRACKYVKQVGKCLKVGEKWRKTQQIGRKLEKRLEMGEKSEKSHVIAIYKSWEGIWKWVEKLQNSLQKQGMSLEMGTVAVEGPGNLGVEPENMYKSCRRASKLVESRGRPWKMVESLEKGLKIENW